MCDSLRVARLLVVGLCLAINAAIAAAEPSVTLKVPPHASTFPNFASIVLPQSGYSSLEVLLEGALGEVQASSVRVTLNGMPMTPFVSVNMMPNGVRTIVKLGVSLSPDYSIRREGESILTFAARDASGTTYRGQFYLSIDSANTEPTVAPSTRARSQEPTVVAPPQHFPPMIQIVSKWPSPTSERTLFLEGEIKDSEGLRRIVIEVNGRDVEEVVLQNERPVRYQGGRVLRATAAGQVSGVGTAIRLNIPIRLSPDRLNVVAIRAENMLGLSSRSDTTVQVLPQ
jgi:hypothetical protein